ncbi:hypothetical protein BsWGS_02249 [Bradybaena similaris]
MPVQLSRASPADSVMTRLWSHSARLHPQIYKARTRINSTSSSLKAASWSPTRKSSSLSLSSSLRRSSQLSQHSATSPSLLGTSRVISQVGKLLDRRLLLRLLVLVLLYQPAAGSAKLLTNMQPDHVIFKSRICQSVSRTSLEKLISPYFNKNRMATDLAAGKRTFGPTFGELGNTEYQGDEPFIGLAVQSADFVEGSRDWTPDGDVWVEEREDVLENTENRMIEEIEDSEIFDRRTWTPRRKVLNRRVPNKSTKVSNRKGYLKNKNDEPEDQRHTTLSDSYSYMKRRRRRSIDNTDASSQSTHPDGDIPSIDEDVDENINFDEYDLEEDNADIDSKDKKSSDNIQLRLFLRGKDKKTRKLLKKKLRQKAKSLTKPPPWECKFTQVNKHMQTGIFPDTLLDGRCEATKCFYRLYSCEAIKYAVKMLRRDPRHCNPLPSLSNETIYEERWDLIQYHATVGCKCASPNSKNSKPKNRRRD